jgi:uncharacterized repeat protein (TIGR03803 family)
MKRFFGTALLLPILASFVLASTPPTALAQTFSLICSFPAEGGSPYAGLTEGPDGRLYGTTAGGGLWGQGSIYVLDPNGSGGFDIVTLYSFTAGLDGANPQATMILASDGYFYGSTFDGLPGLSPGGTIFRVDTAGNLITLHRFFGFDDGYNPVGALIEASDGNLYGVTQSAGGGSGTVFRITRDGDLTVLHVFSLADGAVPSGPVVEGPAGLIYGTTSTAGPTGLGTIYRVSMGGVFESLHAFQGPEGQHPGSGLIMGPDGDLWGTTQITAFRSNLTGTVVDGFPIPNDGDFASTLIVGADGIFYGTTRDSIYWLRTDGLSGTLHTYAANIQGPLVQPADGLLYGTSVQGDIPNTLGTVFRLPPDGSDFDVLAGFGPANARNPQGAFLQGEDGNFYGTALGTFDMGTVFRVDPAGQITTLHLFHGPADGRFPSGLVRKPDGTLLGSTYSGGTNDYGLIFEIDPAGVFSIVHEFTALEGVSPTGLTLAQDDSLWGALSNPPQAFRLGSSQEFIPLHAIEGDFPLGALEEADNGYFYGATAAGGAGGHGAGTLFRVDAASDYASLHTFSGNDGRFPSGAPVQAPDGNFYGMTQSGGAFNFGTIYRMSPEGRVHTIHDFNAVDGSFGYGRLVLGADGNLYGVSQFGGDHAKGNVFRVDGSGNVTNVHVFSGDDGSAPLSQLVQGVDGALYGATQTGGLFGGGVVFRVEPPPASAVWTVTPSSGPNFTPVTVTGAGFNFPEAQFGGADATNETIVNQNAFTAVTPALSPGELYPLHVTNFDGTEAERADAWLADFLDVPQGDIFHAAVESVFRDGITPGCGGGLFCRDVAVTREWMAVFLLRGKHGSEYRPPACTGVFLDVPCPSAFANWIEELFHEGITGGCAPSLFCPGLNVTRAQTAVFLLKAREGSDHVPPACFGVFEDVACPGLFTDWVEELYTEGITGGCSVSPLLYCPTSSSSRGQMSVFLVKAFSLP